MALTLSIALFAAGCNGSTDTPPNSGASSSDSQTSADGQTVDSAQKEVKVLGEGKTKFNFTVTDKEGTETAFEIHTDEETVGGALLALELIAGEEGQYGLYVKTVNGITADYDKDGVYWAFYINGEYALTGVDATKITEGDSYSFRIE